MGYLVGGWFDAGVQNWASSVGDLGDASGVAATLERGGRGTCSTISSARPSPTTRAPIDSTLASLCGARHAGGVQAVAQRGAHAAHLVGGELLTLAAPAEHDAEVGIAVAHGSPDARTDLGVVDRLGRVRALVVDLVALAEQHRHEVLLEVVAGVVGADRDRRVERALANLVHVRRV